MKVKAPKPRLFKFIGIIYCFKVGKVNSKLQRDFWALLMGSAAIFLAAALWSYNPVDPSFSAFGSQLKPTNLCGLVGSFLADGFLQIFGLTSWSFVFLLAFSGYQRIAGKDEATSSLVWYLALSFLSATLLATYWPNTKIFNNTIFIGGILGTGISSSLKLVVSYVGLQIVLWSSVAVVLLFLTEGAVADMVGQKGKKIVAAVTKIRPYLASWVAPKEKSNHKESDLNHESGLNGNNQRTMFPLNEPLTKKPEPGPEVINKQTVFADRETVVSESLSEAPQKRKVTLKAKVETRIENWELPKLSLIEDPPLVRVRVEEREIKRKAELLKQKMAHFSVTGDVTAARPGPAVTLFEFKPDADVKLSKITELADDLALALSSESLRIIAPIPGRDVVGIETSNTQRETVFLKDMLADEGFWRDDVKLPIALGKQADGEPKMIDLRKLPHLMVAGTTGSGKSVFIVSTIIGLIYRHSPKTLRLLLVDPKQVDLAAFDKLPHLLTPIISDSKQAVSALRWAVREMEKRYKSMSKFGARGLEAFNEIVAKLNAEDFSQHEKINSELESSPGKKTEQYYFSPQPYIVIVIEEFADLMSVDKSNVEHSVVRLAQKARACGMHLILAMQSPRKEVVTGLIKTNIPGRISFKVASSMDSRIILDDVGSERLLAQGDMLFRNPGGSNLIRHHGPFLKDGDVAEITKFWSEQSAPNYDEGALKSVESGHEDSASAEGDSLGGPDEYDERYDEILAWAASIKEVSASLIQRRFQLGYPRAARIIETFEREGVVGPANGSKPRQVLVSSYDREKSS
jgi:S-DNA-T family DNA segregation ATPase FtsK/SpoIIIE